MLQKISDDINAKKVSDTPFAKAKTPEEKYNFFFKFLPSQVID